MIIPVGASSLTEAVRYGAEVFHALKIMIGIDAASSEFYKNGTYNLTSEGKKLDSDFNNYNNLIKVVTLNSVHIHIFIKIKAKGLTQKTLFKHTHYWY